MMTPKEALAADGFPVKQGRGRLSREAIERCKVLAGSGIAIKGYEVARPSSTAPSTNVSAPVVNKVAVNNVKEVKEYTIFWPEASFKAVGTDKKVWGMREVCNTCRVSLVQNQCDNPTILGGIKVTITPR